MGAGGYVKKPFIIILALLISSGLFSAGNGVGEEGNKRIKNELLKKDLIFLVRSLEEVHPDLYANYKRDQFKTEVKKVSEQIKGELSPIDFYQLIAPLVAKFQDAHTTVGIPYLQLAEYVRRGGKIFPFDVDCRSGKVIIRKNYSASVRISPGMELISVNKISSIQILEKFASFLSSGSLKFRRVLAGDLFSAYLYLIYGFGSDFELELKESGRAVRFKEVLPGITLQEINKKRRQGEKELVMKFNYKQYPEEKAGLITIDSFSGSGNYTEFLSETFKTIRQEKIKNLIIDIRKNNGGNSQLVWILAGYLTGKEINLVSETRVRASRQIKQMFRERMKKADRKKMSPEALEYLKMIFEAADGTILKLKPEKRVPRSNSLRFQGKVYLLTGIRTFSSAVLFAAAFKDHGWGLIVGEETGAPASHFGEIFSFRLPNSKLNIRVAYKYFIRPSGRTGPEGVIPDIRVSEDRALDIVLDLINKKQIMNEVK